MSPLLELVGLSKRYPGVLANDAVDFSVSAGEIHALLGENGAGKTTLMKMAYGVVQPDAGEIFWQRQRVTIDSPTEAVGLGIAQVFQHFSLLESLTVTENIALSLGSERARGWGGRAVLADKIAELSDAYGLPVNPQALVHDLSIGDRQRVEIVRCLLQSPRLLIMDEPTSVLTPAAVEQLFVTLRQLASDGVGVVYISHKLSEIQALCDRATILRRGKVEGVVDPGSISQQALAEKMIGTAIPVARAPQATVEGADKAQLEGLRINTLSRTPTDDNPSGLHGIDLCVNSGEIVGIAGISGNGQQALIRAISGEMPGADAGEVYLVGEPVGRLSANKRRQRGLGLVPEERLGRGTVPEMSLSQNALLTGAHTDMVRGSWLRPTRIDAFAKRCVDKFQVVCRGIDSAAQSLSGGNVQKFILGREVLLAPRVLLLSQPTWGVDVGAAVTIWQALLTLRAEGVAVLVISEELDELFEYCDQLCVMAEGRLSPQIASADADIAQIGAWMGGEFIRDEVAQRTVASV